MNVGALFPEATHPASDRTSMRIHPAHRGFVESIGARPTVVRSNPLQVVSGSVLEDAYLTWNSLTGDVLDDEVDVLLSVNSNTLYAIPGIKRRFPETTVVALAADFRLFGGGSYDFDGRFGDLLKRAERRIDTLVLRSILSRYADGVLAVSDLMADVVRTFAPPDLPVRVSYPYVQREQYGAFESLSPDLSGNVAITVGEGRDHKGVDLLVDAWPAVRDAHPDAEYHLVGPGHPARFADVAGVEVHGYVDDLASLLEAASLYVQPARFDAFPVAVLEGMLAGLPPLVTTRTGTRSEVRHVDPSLVRQPTVDSLAAGVGDYFSRELTTRRRLSQAARERGSRFDPESRTRAFAEAFERLCADLRPDG